MQPTGSFGFTQNACCGRRTHVLYIASYSPPKNPADSFNSRGFPVVDGCPTFSPTQIRKGSASCDPCLIPPTVSSPSCNARHSTALTWAAERSIMPTWNSCAMATAEDDLGVLSDFLTNRRSKHRFPFGASSFRRAGAYLTRRFLSGGALCQR